jgi:hypothetical protein
MNIENEGIIGSNADVNKLASNKELIDTVDRITVID